MTRTDAHVPFHESDPDAWWRAASGPVRELYAQLRAGEAPAGPTDDPADAAGTAAACAAAACNRLRESIVGLPAGEELRIGGGAW